MASVTPAAPAAPKPTSEPAVDIKSTECGEASQSDAKSEKETLPPLSAKEFGVYNRLADIMELYHNHFRQSWNLLHKACTTGRRPQGMSLRQFIDEGLQFVRGLTMHHDIEESYLYPQLERRMPEFRTSGAGAELVLQHRRIHAGMDVFEDYLARCRRGETELELRVLREKMDSWGEVLWQHLDEEVKSLGADKMRRYWTLEEMKRIGI